MAQEFLHDTKICTKCLIEMPATGVFFSSTTKAISGLRARCKSCTNKDERIRREANPTEGRVRGAAWYAANKERHQSRSATYYAANKDHLEARRLARIAVDPEAARMRWRQWMKQRYHTDPHHRINSCVSSHIRKALKSGKGGKSWQAIVGYSVSELSAHLQRQFAGGMTWENYGKVWEIDHIRPVASFDFSKGAEDIASCWALSNLRPLCVKVNRSKGKKILLLV